MTPYTVKIKRLHPNAALPHQATPGSAGHDLYACLGAPITIAPGERAMIPTGLSIELPAQELAAFIYARSGLATRHGITLSNCVGVVDSDYRGEVTIGLINQSEIPYTIEHGDRIAQMVIAPVAPCTLVDADELESTGRGAGGFGSTGR